MAGSARPALIDQLLRKIFRDTAFANPTSWYISLHTVAPTETSDGTEMTGSGYARLAVAADSGQWNIVNNSAVNSQTLLFAAATATWPTIIGMGLWDAATGGSMLFYESVVAPTVINPGSRFTLVPGSLAVTCGGPGVTNYAADKIIRFLFVGLAGAITLGDFWLALFTTAPTPSSNGTELSASGYSRADGLILSTSFGNFSVLTGLKAYLTSVEPGDEPFYGPAGASWGLLTASGLFDAATGGNLWFFDSATPLGTIATGEQVRFLGGTSTTSTINVTGD